MLRQKNLIDEPSGGFPAGVSEAYEADVFFKREQGVGKAQVSRGKNSLFLRERLADVDTGGLKTSLKQRPELFTRPVPVVIQKSERGNVRMFAACLRLGRRGRRRRSNGR